MILLQKVRLWFRELFRKPGVEQDLADELRFHLDTEIAANVARGMSEADARRRALVAFGAVEDIKDECRDERGVTWLDQLWTDGRYALRSLRREPGFTLVILAVLGLAIGATTAVFSIVDGVLLKPLPYLEPDGIVRIFETAPLTQGGEIRSVANPTLRDWRPQLREFDGLAGYSTRSFDLAGRGRPEQVHGATTDGALFQILGAAPLLGRLFTAEEERPGGPRAVILSYDFWRTHYGADPKIVGSAIALDRLPFTVVGVLRPGFGFPSTATVWTSLAVDAEYDARGARHLNVLARLRSGSTIEAATADLLAAERVMAGQYPKNYSGYGVRLVPLKERTVGSVRPLLVTLLGAVVLVLLIACTNAANLLLARALARRREIAVRLSLGASQGRLARQLITESLVLFVTAGALGWLVAYWIVSAVRAVKPGDLPRLDEVALDFRVLAFAAGVSILCGIVFGLAPALEASRPDLQRALKEGGRTSTAGGGLRLRMVLTASETAIATILLVGSGLLIRSLDQLSRVDPGLRTDNLLTFHVGLPPEKSDDGAAITAFYRTVHDRLAELPGVLGVGLTSRLPLSSEDHSTTFKLEGEPTDGPATHSAQDRAVSSGYFAALGIPVTRGREFTAQDGPGAPGVALINQTMARRYFPARDPVGRQLILGEGSLLIVGVVGDTRQFSLDLPAEPELYQPHAQRTWPWLSIAVRTAADPIELVPAVQRVIWSLDPEMPLTSIQSMDAMVADGIGRRRLMTVILSGFGAAAFLLAIIGLYGVIAYQASQRAPEIGIRMALGARRPDVLRLIVGKGLRVTLAGLVVGLVGAIGLSRFLRGFLYQVDGADPVTLAAIALVLPLVAALASWIPARRAARIDPATALRSE